MWIELIIISAVVISAVIIYIKNENKKKIYNEPEVISNLEKIVTFNTELLKLSQDYITKPQEEYLRAGYQNLYKTLTQRKYTKLRNTSIEDFINAFTNLSTNIKGWNKAFVEGELLKHQALFNDIDGNSLDSQQRRAVVVDEDNNLVLAGAGSGKTLTIAGKVKYLVETKNINPDEILLISFTRKAAEEMRTRITDKLHIGVEVKTFHALGLNIIQHTYPEKYEITKDGYLNNLVENYFNKSSHDDKKQMQNIITFFSYYLNIPKDWGEFDNLGDCIDHYKNSDYETLKRKVNIEEEVQNTAIDLKMNKTTLQGEIVKSLEEVMIANILFLNGVEYEYEKKYPFDTNDNYRKVYQPDFYLIDYDIYIEHFGITEDYKTPWLPEIEEKKYIEGIKWKRNLHKENKTKLIETYSYYNKNGILLSELEKKLKDAGVKFKEVDYAAIYKKVFNRTDNKYFSEFIKLVSTFIKLFKSGGYNENSFVDFLRQNCMVIIF